MHTTLKMTRAAMVTLSMSPMEKEMAANLESAMYVANMAGDPHHWERSTFGAVRKALEALATATIDRCNRNVPAEAARSLGRQVVAGMLDNHEDMSYNFDLIAKGTR